MIVKVPEKKVEIQKQNWLLMHTVELHYNRIISCETQMTDHGTVLDVEKVDSAIWWINYYQEDTY